MISIESNIPRVNTHLQDIQRRLSDLTPFWNDYALSLVEGSFKDVFSSGGFGLWDALDPRYAAEKAKAYPGRPILVRIGAYRAAATSALNQGNIFETTPTEMVYGVSGDDFASRFGAPYPFFHEGGHGVPERETAGLVGEHIDTEISRLLDRWVSEEIAEEERR